MNNGKITNHHVILAKYGEDIYIDETTVKSGYPTEGNRIEDVVVISGSLTGTTTITLTKYNVDELIEILQTTKHSDGLGVKK